MKCDNLEKNKSACNCTSGGCPRHGRCCECLASHRAAGELPACFFTKEQEATYDRSVEYFIKCRQ